MAREPVPLREPVRQQSLQQTALWPYGRISVVLLDGLGLLYSRKPTALTGAERVRLGVRLGKQALRLYKPGDHVHGEATMIA